MKKMTSILLSFALLLSLTACGGEAAPDDSSDAAVSSASEGNAEGNNTEGQTAGTEEQTADTEGQTADTGGQLVFEEMVAVDNEECSIILTEMEPDSLDYTLKARLENKSSEKICNFLFQDAAINGMCYDGNGYYLATVYPGEKANVEIIFPVGKLKDNGVGEPTDIEFTLHVYAPSDNGNEVVAEETINIYPYGEDKATVFTREALSTDHVIADNDSVTIIVTGCVYNRVNLFLVNKTDEEISLTASEASVNDYMVDLNRIGGRLPSGKCYFIFISWDDSTLEENGIADIESIEFLLKATASSTTDGNSSSYEVFNEVVTLTP